MRLSHFASIAFFVTISSPWAFAQDTLNRLVIETENAEHVFFVEIAATDADIERGLMDRTDLPEDAGMLFDFNGLQVAEMWMKNTPLSLDMLFITSDGTVLAIAHNTAPQSERRIGAGAPVRAVLEVNSGTAKRLGIAPGSTVKHPLFGNIQPVQ